LIINDRIHGGVILMLCTVGYGKDGEYSHIGALNFYPIFIPRFEGKVSGVSVQDILLSLPLLTPDT
jgi:hypothetical protein